MDDENPPSPGAAVSVVSCASIAFSFCAAVGTYAAVELDLSARLVEPQPVQRISKKIVQTATEKIFRFTKIPPKLLYSKQAFGK